MTHERTLSAQTRHNMLVARLLGWSLEDTSSNALEVRLAILIRLNAAHTAEVTRGQTGSWLYDVNRQLNLSVALTAEERAIEARLPVATADQALLIRAALETVKTAKSTKFGEDVKAVVTELRGIGNDVAKLA